MDEKYEFKMEHPDMGSCSMWVIREKKNKLKQWRVKLPDEIIGIARDSGKLIEAVRKMIENDGRSGTVFYNNVVDTMKEIGCL